MSNELLIAVDTMLKSLPPEVRAIVISWAGELAATLTSTVIGGLNRSLRRQIIGTPNEKALKDAFEAGLTACMAVLAPPDAWRKQRYRASLRHFLEQEEVADEFAVLVDVRPDVELDIQRLRGLFERDGRDLAQLPGLNFDDAMRAFAMQYCDAVERSGMQKHVDNLRYLKQIVWRLEDVHHETVLTGEELVRVREAVGTVEIALKQGLEEQTRALQKAIDVYASFPGDAVSAMKELASRTAELSDAILDTIRSDAEVFGRADLETKEAAFRLLVVSEFERLAFRGMLQHGQPVTLPLEQVYVSLRAARRIPTADTPEMDRLRRQLEEHDARRAQEESPFLDGEERAELQRQLDELQRTYWQEETKAVDIGAALANQDNLGMVILGDPGAGKTTLLKYLALVFAQEAAGEELQLDEQRLPIFLPLAFYDAALTEDSTVSLCNYLAAYYATERNLAGLEVLFDTVLREGRAIVLLDGLDEVLDAETRSRVARRAEAFLRQETRRGNRVLLTSRIVGYRGIELPADIPHFTILDMEPDAVNAFLVQWARALTCQIRGEPFKSLTARAREEADELAKGLREAIEGTESVRRLAVNPLLLTILVVVYTQEGMVLPRRRVELYDRYAHVLIETWRRTRTSGRFVGKEMEFLPTAKILGPLALWLQEEWPSGTARGPRLRERLRWIFLERGGWQPGQRLSDEQESQAYRRSEDFLADVREYAGVLVERGRDTYGFLHLTFQEYFAAWWLAKMEPAERLTFLGPHLHDPRWKEVILLTAGHLGVIDGNERLVSDFVETILDSESPMPLLCRDLLLAASCLSDDVGVHADLGQAVVQRLIELLSSDVPALAQAAGQALGRLGGTDFATQVANTLAELLHGEVGTGERHAAVSILGQLDHASPTIIASLLSAIDDYDEDVRQASALSLCRLARNSTQAFERLITALANGNWNMRLAVVRAVGQLHEGRHEVIQAVASILETGNWRMRHVAVRTLIQLDYRIPDMIDLLICDLGAPEWNTRRSAASILGDLDQAPLAVIEALATALTDRDDDVRQVAADSLVRLRMEAAEVAKVVSRVQKNYSGRASQTALSVLAQMNHRTEEVVKTFIRALSDPIAYVRRTAAEALGAWTVASPEVVTAFEAALKDNEWMVRHAAAVALIQIDHASTEALETLLAALTHRDERVRESAARGIGQLEQWIPALVEALASTIYDHSWNVRRAAADSLIRLGRQVPDTAADLTFLPPASRSGDKPFRELEPGACLLKAIVLVHLGHGTPECIQLLATFLDRPMQKDTMIALYQKAITSPGHGSSFMADFGRDLETTYQMILSSLVQSGQSDPQVLAAISHSLEVGSPIHRDAAYHALLALAPKYGGWVVAATDLEQE